MVFSKTNAITFIRGDDDAMMVALTSGSFHEGDKVFFSLKDDPSNKEDIFTIEADTFLPYNEVDDSAVVLGINHAHTIDLALGDYFYSVWIKWRDGSDVTPIPPIGFKLVPGGSHD